MACMCKNDDGSWADKCFGICGNNINMINPDKQERAMEDSFTMNQLQQIKMIVREALSVSITLDGIWQDGFIKGFKEGYEYGK